MDQMVSNLSLNNSHSDGTRTPEPMNLAPDPESLKRNRSESPPSAPPPESTVISPIASPSKFRKSKSDFEFKVPILANRLRSSRSSSDLSLKSIVSEKTELENEVSDCVSNVLVTENSVTETPPLPHVSKDSVVELSDSLALSNGSYPCRISNCHSTFKTLRPLLNHIQLSHLTRSASVVLSDANRPYLLSILEASSSFLCQKCLRIWPQTKRCSCDMVFNGQSRVCGSLFSVAAPALPFTSSASADYDMSTIQTDDFKPFSEFPDIFLKLRQLTINSVDYVPNRLRSLFGKLLLELVEELVRNPESLDRAALLQIFPLCILNQPDKKSRESKGSNQIFRNRLLDWQAGGDKRRQLFVGLVSKELQSIGNSRLSQSQQNIRRCKKLISLGRFGDATKSLSSLGVSKITPQVLAELQKLHPKSANPEIPSGDTPPAVIVDFPLVLEQLKRFPRGSACGNDGLRASHLLQAYSGCYAQNQEALGAAITKYVNLLLSGSISKDLAPVVCGAKLVALPKPNGKIRPIAVGEIWRRLAAKCAMACVRLKAAEYFSPNQLGVAVPSGCEAIVTAAQELAFKLSVNSEKVLLKIDAENAFNLVDRSTMFEQVRNVFPELSAFVEWCYGSAPHLFAGDYLLSSEAGVQQGDPLGPLLFALTIHPLILEMKNRWPKLDLLAFYLDDGTLVGDCKDVAAAFKFFCLEGPKFGIKVNMSKCQVWSPYGPVSDVLNIDLFPAEICRWDEDGIDLLGSPIGSVGYTEAFATSKVEKIADLLDKIHIIEHAQYELILLRHTAGFCKFNFVLRTCDHRKIQGAIAKFDQLMHDSLEKIWNASLASHQRLLIHLPVNQGGFGIPAASLSAASARLGALANSLVPRNRLLGNEDDHLSLDFYQAMTYWNSSATSPIVAQDILAASKPQHWLQSQVNAKLRGDLLSSCSDRFKALINACSYSHSGDWLRVVPIRDLRLEMPSNAYQRCLQYRLGIPLYPTEVTCGHCGAISDCSGDHDSWCRGSLQRVSVRHNAVRDLLFLKAAEAQLGPQKEPQNLIAQHGELRPADVFIPNFRYGRDMCIDVSIVSPFLHIEQASATPGFNANFKASQKISKYQKICQENGLDFVPFVMESIGGFHPDSIQVINRLARKIYSKNPLVSISENSFRIRSSLQFAAQKAMGLGFLSREAAF